MLRHQLVQVRRAVLHSRFQCREEQLVLVGVVGDELFSVSVVVLAHRDDPGVPDVGFQRCCCVDESVGVRPQCLMDELDESEVRLGSVWTHTSV